MEESNKLCELGKAVLSTEAAAVSTLIDRIDNDFIAACRHLEETKGRIIVTGMGKSGHVCKKIAATLASTGSPAFFVHPAEASHGDLGMITQEDVVLAISYSGETEEVLALTPTLKRLDIPLVTVTGNQNSTLAKLATVNIDVSVEKEACPLGLAPTASTTATLAMGDALAISLLHSRGFTADDFALSHPAGSLGKRLLLRVADIMHTDDAIPRIKETALLSEALLEVSQKGFGITSVIDAQGRLSGVFTDGDLRRTIEKSYDIHTTPIIKVMTHGAKTTAADTLAAEALKRMKDSKITSLFILEDGFPVGFLHIHDLLRAGIS